MNTLVSEEGVHVLVSFLSLKSIQFLIRNSDWPQGISKYAVDRVSMQELDKVP